MPDLLDQYHERIKDLRERFGVDRFVTYKAFADSVDAGLGPVTIYFRTYGGHIPGAKDVEIRSNLIANLEANGLRCGEIVVTDEPVTAGGVYPENTNILDYRKVAA